MFFLQARNVDKVKYLSLFLYSVMIYTNYLANALPIGGITTGEVSDLLDYLFTPSGFTFSIWGVIYLSLFTFLISLFKISDNLKPFNNFNFNIFKCKC